MEPSLRFHAAHLYFDREASYRALARQLHVGRHRVFRWIDALGGNCKTFVDVTRELRPQWGGFLLLDGKTIYVRGEKHALLLCADAQTHDIPEARFAPAERTEYCEPMLESLRDEIGYPIRGITLDGDWGLWRACQHVFPDVPLQLCVRHTDQYLCSYFKYEYTGSGRGVHEFLDLTHRLLYATSKPHLADLLGIWQERRQALKYCGLEHELCSFEDKMPYLFTHLDHPGMPRTTNIIEGIIRQLSRKIDKTDGFESVETAWHSLQLLIMRYRFHRFTDARTEGHNGRAPLELAGVNIGGVDWAKFSQR